MASTHPPLSQKGRPSLTQANGACGRLSVFSGQGWVRRLLQSSPFSERVTLKASSTDSSLTPIPAPCRGEGAKEAGEPLPFVALPGF